MEFIFSNEAVTLGAPLVDEDCDFWEEDECQRDEECERVSAPRFAAEFDMLVDEPDAEAAAEADIERGKFDESEAGGSPNGTLLEDTDNDESALSRYGPFGP